MRCAVQCEWPDFRCDTNQMYRFQHQSSASNRDMHSLVVFTFIDDLGGQQFLNDNWVCMHLVSYIHTHSLTGQTKGGAV